MHWESNPDIEFYCPPVSSIRGALVIRQAEEILHREVFESRTRKVASTISRLLFDGPVTFAVNLFMPFTTSGNDQQHTEQNTK